MSSWPAKRSLASQALLAHPGDLRRPALGQTVTRGLSSLSSRPSSEDHSTEISAENKYHCSQKWFSVLVVCFLHLGTFLSNGGKSGTA